MANFSHSFQFSLTVNILALFSLALTSSRDLVNNTAVVMSPLGTVGLFSAGNSDLKCVCIVMFIFGVFFI